ncbi:hypothetical protein O9G_002357, partial [Rozella allomycis CSF55]
MMAKKELLQWVEANCSSETAKECIKNFIEDSPFGALLKMTKEDWKDEFQRWGTFIYNELHPTIPMEIDQQNGPRGEQVDLSNPRALLNFMNMQMIDVSKLFASCRLLSEEKRKIAFSGREAAINQAAEKFKVFADPFGKDKETRKLPVASGLSGLGKTRLMDEWERIFDEADVLRPRFGVLVPYYNGHNPQPVEEAMKIEASFSWRLLEEAIAQAADKFKMFANPVGKSKVELKIPVASGLSGLGKTRLMEEFERILDLAGVGQPRFGVLVPYYNGHNPQPVEKSMQIEASFSWRLLYRVFIEGHGVDFIEWFETCLPVNGAELTLRKALKVIRMKAVGIKVGREELLQDLINAIGGIVASPVEHIRIYPMFAGTDFSAISIVNSTKTETLRLPMSLLSDAEMARSIESIPCGIDLLKQTPVRRHLFYLGGVPRWFTEYILLLVKDVSGRYDKVPTVEEAEKAFQSVKIQYIAAWGKINIDGNGSRISIPYAIIHEIASDDKVPTVEEAEKAFKSIKACYIEAWGKVKENGMYKTLKEIDFIKLAAHSFSGLKVVLNSKVIGNLSWARLRDSSVCLINGSRISIPYAIIHEIASYKPAEFSSRVIKRFIECLKGLVEKV